MKDMPAVIKRQISKAALQGFQPNSSETDKRKRRITQQLERLRDNLTNKVRKNYKSDHSYRQQQKRTRELIYELESELSILNCPGEYDELPIAVVADELGLTYTQVNALINLAEIEARGKKAHERISRKELERITSLGVRELLQASQHTSSEIFEEAISFFEEGETDLVERAYARLNARESWQGVYAPACLIALELLKGELENALFSIRCINEEVEPSKRIVVLEHLGRLLQRLKLKDDGTRNLSQQIILMANAGSTILTKTEVFSIKHQKDKDLEKQSTYLASAVQIELRKNRFKRRNKRFGSAIEKHKVDFDSLIRDAIYTALYAEATYEKFLDSKAYVNSIRLSACERFQRVRLLIPINEE
jgi:hypothetical protein